MIIDYLYSWIFENIYIYFRIFCEEYYIYFQRWNPENKKIQKLFSSFNILEKNKQIDFATKKIFHWDYPLLCIELYVYILNPLEIQLYNLKYSLMLKYK